MQPVPVLYSFRRCPYAIRARMALVASGKRVELREVDLKHKPSEMLFLSPKGTVPVLQLNGGVVLEESLDIMLWALNDSDPMAWWQDLSDSEKAGGLALISENDETFKYWLDRYKYSVGYPDMSKEAYREKCLEFVQKLEARLKNQAWLFSDRCSLADVAIFPFVRQFAFVDKSWFDSAEYCALQKWLVNLLESDLFKKIMTKHQPWQDGNHPLHLN